MKSLLFLISFFCLLNSAFSYEQAIIRNIENEDLPANYVEVSEEGLPQDHYVQLINMLEVFRFTIEPEAKIRDVFESLKKNPQARMRYPKGSCSNRRAYIQNYLGKMNIISGKIFIHCPAINGRLRLKDQVSNHVYSFANFHDTNIVAVQTNAGSEFRVLDLQFEDAPVSLHDYLSEIEVSQKIRPLKRKGTTRNLCYWTITTPYKSY